MVETWVWINGFEGEYKISNFGRVLSVSRPRATGGKTKTRLVFGSGFGKYKMAVLTANGKYHRESIHRLVARHFIPNPDNLPQVNHKNGNTLNNCVENLEWCTASQNTIHAYAMGLQTNPNRKPIKIIESSGAEIVFPSLQACAEYFGKSKTWLCGTRTRQGRSFVYNGVFIDRGTALPEWVKGGKS